MVIVDDFISRSRTPWKNERFGPPTASAVRGELINNLGQHDTLPNNLSSNENESSRVS